ncbi:hypothetical protein [Fastidiosibacter lacustris]|uniref:hypothetical protein n=1 Tax=Fastidiosibacter lacustris TaxID=2056695 RepID=UPI000E351F91|nr:hypothetical protein [Fastidiosibacter lacustris]
MDSIESVLEFWQLCELSDFKRFNCAKENVSPLDLSQINKFKQIANEYSKSNNKDYRVKIDNKTTNIYKVYLGLIQAKEAIRYVYDAFKKSGLLGEDIDIINALEKEFEKIKKQDCTYLAYLYLDHNLNIVSIKGNCFNINPIFYISAMLPDKSKLNNFELNNFAEGYSDEFKIKHEVINRSNTIVIPDVQNLLKIGQYPNALKTLLSCDKCTHLYIFNETINEILNIANTLSHPCSKNASNILDEISKVKNNQIEEPRQYPYICFAERRREHYEHCHEEYLLNSAIKLPSEQPFSFVFLYTKHELRNFSINLPINLYLITWFDKELFYTPPLVS